MPTCNNCRPKLEMVLIKKSSGDVYRCPLCKNEVPVEEVDARNVCPIHKQLVTQCDCESHAL